MTNPSQRGPVPLLLCSVLSACTPRAAHDPSPPAMSGAPVAGSLDVAGMQAESGSRASADAAAGAVGHGGAAPTAGMPAGTGAAGSGGLAGQPASAPDILPIEQAGKYVLEIDDVRFEIDPQLGARVTRFSLAGQNLLTGSDVNPDNWGSTFWPSPQQRWNWPPVPELDTQPYNAAITRDVIALESMPGVRAKVRVTKQIKALVSERAIELTYVLTNTDSAAVSWAPWEVSRVAAGGITFFPSGDKAVTTALAVTNMGEITWYRHDPSALASGGQKFTADGSGGWLAHVAGTNLFVKQFFDVPLAQQAPAPEAEIGIYAAANYVELEPQGPYTLLMPGESVRWRVRWYARALPSAVMPTLGNPALVSFVRALLAP